MKHRGIGGRAGVAALLLAALLLPPARAARDVGDHQGPVSLQSPAWRDLMAEPVVQDDTLAYHAASVAGLWGRPDEKEALFDRLLLLHGQALAGQAPPARLGDLLDRPPADRQAVQAAWDAGLNHAWSKPAWDAAEPAAGLAEGAVPWPGRPGFWRLPGGRLAVQAVVGNAAPFVIALPRPPRLVLRTETVALALDCAAPRGGTRWLPGERARWWCTSAGAPPPAVLSGEPRILWSMEVPSGGELRDRWVDVLAGRQPFSVAGLIERHAHCRDQMNCRQGRVPTTDELAAMKADAEARGREERQRVAREDARDRAATPYYLLAVALAGFGLYALCARVLGTATATAGWVVLALGAATWVLATSRGTRGWDALAMAIVVLGLVILGPALAFFYRWLYRVFFNRR